MGIAIMDWAIGNNIGFSKFVSLGNKADLSETDLIEYLARDPATDIILGYIEDVVNGARFLDVARGATKKKPVILLKSGGTEAGAPRPRPIPVALAGSDTAFNAAFRQCGVQIRAFRNLVHHRLAAGDDFDRQNAARAFAQFDELERRRLPWRPLSRHELDYTSFDLLYRFLQETKPSLVINAAGYTGKPNLDACETRQADTLAGNVVLPVTIANACAALDIPFEDLTGGWKKPCPSLLRE